MDTNRLNKGNDLNKFIENRYVHWKLEKEEGGGNSTPQAPVGMAVTCRSYKGGQYLSVTPQHNVCMYVTRIRILGSTLLFFLDVFTN